jgi:hypothetical protein
MKKVRLWHPLNWDVNVTWSTFKLWAFWSNQYVIWFTFCLLQNLVTFWAQIFMKKNVFLICDQKLTKLYSKKEFQKTMLSIDFRPALGGKLFWNIGENTESSGPQWFWPQVSPKDFDPPPKKAHQFPRWNKYALVIWRTLIFYTQNPKEIFSFSFLSKILLY